MNSLSSQSWLSILFLWSESPFSAVLLWHTPHLSASPTRPPFLCPSPVLASCNQGHRPWLSAEAFSCCKSPFMILLVCVCDMRVYWLCVLCMSVCVCMWVCHECCGRQAAVKRSLSWPTFPPASPQLAPSECTRSNASHSSRFHVITAFPCNHSFAFSVFSLCCVLTLNRLIEIPHIEVKRI